MLQQCSLLKLLPRLFTGWCTAAFIETLYNPVHFSRIEFANSVSMLRFVLIIIFITATLTVITYLRRSETVQTWVMVGSVLLYLFSLGLRYSAFWTSVVYAIVMIFVAVYTLPHDRLKLSAFAPSKRTVITVIAVATAIFTAYTGGVTVCRYLGYSSSTFDLGIFSQMFHYMKTTGLPFTTCERGELLSHFAVHISPIWYVLLPGYMLFSSPVYLQIMQAIILASAVIPLYLLLTHHQLSQKTVLAVCLIFLSFPALTGGCFYDIHENCFLTPILLWLFYTYDKQKWVPFSIMAVLLLSVKEDAAIYLAAFGVYLLCNRRDYRRGGILLAVSVIYFLIAAYMLFRFGDGEMTAVRYDNFLADGQDGMVDVIKNAFVNPAYLFSQILTAKRVQYLILMLLPLLGLPLMSKDLSGLTLLLPILAINLMSGWEYQYSIHFQYSFGSIACLFYLTICNLKTLKDSVKSFILPTAVCVSILLATANLSMYRDNFSGCIEYRQVNANITAVLNDIPADAGVRADGFLLPHLANRDILYDFTTNVKTEYIVLDLRPGREKNEQHLAALQADTDTYEQIHYTEDEIAVFRDKTY